MIEYKTIKTYICDVCGDKYTEGDKGNEYVNSYKFSTYISDEGEESIELCESCQDRVFLEFRKVCQEEKRELQSEDGIKNLYLSNKSFSKLLSTYCNLIDPGHCTVKDLFSIRDIHECPFHGVACNTVVPSDWETVLCNYRVKAERGDEYE